MILNTVVPSCYRVLANRSLTRYVRWRSISLAGERFFFSLLIDAGRFWLIVAIGKPSQASDPRPVPKKKWNKNKNGTGWSSTKKKQTKEKHGKAFCGPALDGSFGYWSARWQDENKEKNIEKKKILKKKSNGMVEARRCSWFAPRMNIGWPKSEEMCRRWIKQDEPLFRQERAANANRHSHAHFRIGNNIWKKNPASPTTDSTEHSYRKYHRKWVFHFNEN